MKDASVDQNGQGDHLIVGKITSFFGVRGWVKVHSFMEPDDNILKSKEWNLKVGGKWQSVKIDQGRRHGKGIVVLIDGCSSREDAERYLRADIEVRKDSLPYLTNGEYYWHQLQGLQVITVLDVRLGTVSHLMETGSNDVLVVQGNSDSVDDKERLLPYLPDQVIKSIDLDAGEIRVDWDPEF